MSLLIDIAQVIFGAFVMFTFANSRFRLATTSAPTRWCLLVGFMTFGVMLFYRLINHDINVPSFTVLLFIITMSGMDANLPKGLELVAMPTIKKARRFAIGGWILGSLTFAEIVTM